MSFAENSSDLTPGQFPNRATESSSASDPSAPTDVTPNAGSGSDAGVHSMPTGLVGTTVDSRYFIEKELGHGGVGVVYLARDRKLLDKAVVVKVLLESSLRNERVVQKFQQEKEALTRVDHPGIIGILDTGELPDGKPYLVMQYVAGVNLRSALTPEGMSLERAASIIRQLGSALSAAHEQGVFHRDLKPENIMLQPLSSGEEQVRIIDFGVAKIKNSLVALSTMTPTTLGTYGYMSPEQFRGERVTAASDIYSLGVIAYEMVTGRRPFNPETVGHLGEVQREGVRVKPKDLRPALPEAAQNVILKALMYAPSDRYDNARYFGDTLCQALLDETPAPVGPARPINPAASPLADTITDGIGLPNAASGRASRFSFSLNTSWLKVAISFVFVAAFLTATFGVFTFSSLKSPMVNANTSGPMPTNDATPGSNANSTANSNYVPEQRSINYWLTVQKMRDGQPYEQPFKSSGQEIFETGYKFRLHVSSPQSGYLYLLNEGTSADGGMNLTLIYPTPARNNGSAAVRPRQSVETGWNVFRGQPGTEQFRLVWSVAPVPELEAAREAAFQTENGSLTNANLVRTVKEFLMNNDRQKLEVVKNTARRETVVKGYGDLLISLLELEHR